MHAARRPADRERTHHHSSSKQHSKLSPCARARPNSGVQHRHVRQYTLRIAPVYIAIAEQSR
jgi:hypothetical protein